jgi:hypothetical protein
VPSLYEILDHLQFITGELAVLGLFITGSLMVLLRDWRGSLLALLAQYLLAGLILSRLVLPEVAVIKVLVGALICPMLYLAVRQAGWMTRREKDIGLGSGKVLAWRKMFSAGRPFRLLAVTLMALLAVALNQALPLPSLPFDVGLATYWLILVGLLILMLTEEPLKAGQGLLTVVVGFELFYTTAERSLIMIWMWAAVNLLLTLAVAYLAVARDVDSAEEGL